MGKINLRRVLLGGIVAGIVADVLGFLVDGVWLAQRWAEGQKTLGHTAIPANGYMWLNVNALICGILVVWLYAALRPRFGAGVKTAMIAGLFFWVAAKLLPHVVFMVTLGLFSKHLALYTTLGELVEVVAAAIVGAWLYKEA